MKRTLILTLATYSLHLAAQDKLAEKPQQHLHILVAGGTIRHEFETVSQNGHIRGLPAFDYATSIVVNYDVPTRNIVLTSGLQLNSLTNIYETSSTVDNDFDARSRSIIGSTGYFKMFINYGYRVKLRNKLSLIANIGPSINISRTFGVYDYYQYSFQEIENNVIVKTVITKYVSERIRKNILSSQFGLTLQKSIKKDILLYVSSQYNWGFDDFNKTSIALIVNGNFRDEANVFSRTRGVSFLIGIGLPLNI